MLSACHAREGGHPVIVDRRECGSQGLLDYPVKPGNDNVEEGEGSCTPTTGGVTYFRAPVSLLQRGFLMRYRFAA
jgi:hypothetical protein